MDNVTDKFPDVYSYILSEEKKYKTTSIPLSENWEWSMFDHIDRSFTLKNSQFTQGANDFSRPFNNIILPIANVNYRSEGFDVKGVDLFVNNQENYYKSFLTRKFHARWAKKYGIDEAIDESVESYFDYGLVLVKNVNQERPKIVPLQQIAFCDQTEILSGALCLKHQYGIDEMLEMKDKWDEDSVNLAIAKSRFSQQRHDGKQTQTPGKYVEVYELHGIFPKNWLKGDTYDESEYSRQMHIVTYYVDGETNQKNGITLFSTELDKPIFKRYKRDAIYGRACGRGGIEELFHPQIWTNYSEIHLQQILEAVSKVVLKTTDKKVAKNNNLKKLKHNQVITVEQGTDINQLQITAPNKAAFDNFVNKWEQVARVTGSASDPQLGLNPTSGTPLGTTEIVTSQGMGMHQYRQGKIAWFWGEIYRDWVLPYLAKEMARGDEWLEELSVDEIREISEIVSTNYANDKFKEKILKGELMTKEEMEQVRATFKENFGKAGQKRFLKILKDELKDVPIDVDFSIVGKQSNMAEMVSKLNSIFRSVFQNPQMLQNPGIAELFNNILESSGISPVNFASFTTPEQTQPGQTGAPMTPELTSPEPAMV